MTAIASLALGQTLLAQRETRRPPQGTRKVLIFKSKGAPLTSEDDGSSAPPNLSVASKKEMLKELNLPSEPSSVYIKLTPRNSYVAGKGFLHFRNPNVVASSVEHAYWGPPLNDEKFVEIRLKSEAAGRRYLIDCAVKQVYGSNYPFKIWKGLMEAGVSFNASDLLQTIESVGAQGQHLVFLLDATDNGWHTFRISGGAGWYFYSCEVTNL